MTNAYAATFATDIAAAIKASADAQSIETVRLVDMMRDEALEEFESLWEMGTLPVDADYYDANPADARGTEIYVSGRELEARIILTESGVDRPIRSVIGHCSEEMAERYAGARTEDER